MKKVILITGASSGMGKVTAEDLIKKGHTVYCAARSVGKMENLKKLGGRVIKLDISNENEVNTAVDKIINEEGKIDILWNNAGFGLFGAIEDVSIETARYQFEVNLFGLARLTQLVIPYMRRRKSGLIINTSSIGGKIYSPLGAWYHATKHALEGWSDCLRLELKQFDIKVVIVEPGAIYTGFEEVMADHVIKYSGDGVYGKMTKALVKANKKYNNEKSASPASVISNTIQKIIKSKNPKTRYAVGKLAVQMLFARKWFSDRTFDLVLRSMIK